MNIELFAIPCFAAPATVWTSSLRVCSDDSIKLNLANTCRVPALWREVSGVLGIEEWTNSLQRPLPAGLVPAGESSPGRS